MGWLKLDTRDSLASSNADNAARTTLESEKSTNEHIESVDIRFDERDQDIHLGYSFVHLETLDLELPFIPKAEITKVRDSKARLWIVVGDCNNHLP